MPTSVVLPTAAALIIGNEILSGRTPDENIAVIAQKMTEMGVDLKEVRIVPDEESRIVEALNPLRRTHDYVFTTGGIGSTHDDITMKAIAKAFGVPLVESPEAYKALSDYFGPGQMNEARRRMALVPQGASLLPNAATAAPGARVGNVFILAGVPDIMKAMLDSAAATIARGPTIHIRTVRSEGLLESVIADDLAVLADLYAPAEIGSYPTFRQGKVGLSLVVRSRDPARATEATAAIAALFRAHGVRPQVAEGY